MIARETETDQGSAAAYEFVLLGITSVPVASRRPPMCSLVRPAGWTADRAGQIIAVMTDVAPEQDRMAGFFDRTIIKLMYKPIGLIASVAGGMLASMLFGRIWRALTGKGDVPEVTDKAKGWADILPAAALHGVVFGVVKALVDRAGAKEFERLTGRWPGKESRAETGISD